ncbi:DUF1840 family protein [Thaumasiovibrio sp. DFM-14]|uniref:DUF1840 family protein n=1 Tax=Thaumasiovibrio sp. DFM-14 TaxID=3384792 RepID=UPI00399F6E83
MITFKSKHHADVVMFDDVATDLMAMMNVTSRVPGILRGADIQQALSCLKDALQCYISPEVDESDDEDSSEPVVGLDKRAWPLIEMLQCAVKEGDDVVWE